MLVKYKGDDTGELLPVFGVKKKQNRTELLIACNHFLTYCVADEYEMIDKRVSLFWQSSPVGDCMEHVFPEWDEPFFYENLSNDGPRELFLLDRYHDIFMREFSQSFLLSARFFDQGWGQCPNCDEVFENNSYWGVIRCPKCHYLLNNPMENHDLLLGEKEILLLKRHMIEYKNMYFYEKDKKYHSVPPM